MTDHNKVSEKCESLLNKLLVLGNCLAKWTSFWPVQRWAVSAKVRSLSVEVPRNVYGYPFWALIFVTLFQVWTGSTAVHKCQKQLKIPTRSNKNESRFCLEQYAQCFLKARKYLLCRREMNLCSWKGLVWLQGQQLCSVWGLDIILLDPEVSTCSLLSHPPPGAVALGVSPLSFTIC